MAAKKISRTPKRAPATEQDDFTVPSIFDHFGIEDKPARKAAPKADPVEEKDERDARIEELTRRLDELQKANLALMSSPAPTQTNTPSPPKELDLSGLPDPVAEPEKYAAELNKRINENLNARLAHVQSQTTLQQDQQKKFDDLWKDFSAYAPEIAKYEKRVQFIASDLIADAKARGLDVNKYVFGAREQFFADINKAYEKEFGPIKPTNVEADEEEEEDTVEDNGRAAAIFGGLESGGAVPKGRPNPKEMGDMLQDIKDIQRRTGFF